MFLHDDQRSANPAVVVVDRAVPVGPVHLFDSAVTKNRNEIVVVPRRPASGHHRLYLRSDGRPDPGPELPASCAERGRMPVSTEAWTVAVVIELDEAQNPTRGTSDAGSSEGCRGPSADCRTIERWAPPVSSTSQTCESGGPSRRLPRGRSENLIGSPAKVNRLTTAGGVLRVFAEPVLATLYPRHQPCVDLKHEFSSRDAMIT